MVHPRRLTKEVAAGMDLNNLEEIKHKIEYKTEISRQ